MPSALLFDDCPHEYGALLRLYADTQTRCSAHICAQQAEIQRLSAEVLQLRARAIVQETALDWERHAQQTLQAEIQALQALLQPLSLSQPAPQPASTCDLHTFSERATELLICQTGCVEHNDHWRHDDSCKRTGKACVLALQPNALEMLHAHRVDASEQVKSVEPALAAAPTTVEAEVKSAAPVEITSSF